MRRLRRGRRAAWCAPRGVALLSVCLSSGIFGCGSSVTASASMAPENRLPWTVRDGWFETPLDREIGDAVAHASTLAERTEEPACETACCIRIRTQVEGSEASVRRVVQHERSTVEWTRRSDGSASARVDVEESHARLSITIELPSAGEVTDGALVRALAEHQEVSRWERAVVARTFVFQAGEAAFTLLQRGGGRPASTIERYEAEDGMQFWERASSPTRTEHSRAEVLAEGRVTTSHLSVAEEMELFGPVGPYSSDTRIVEHLEEGRLSSVETTFSSDDGREDQRTVALRYDERGRLVAIAYGSRPQDVEHLTYGPDGSIAVGCVRRRYDEAGRLLHAGGCGPVGLRVARDAQGRPTEARVVDEVPAEAVSETEGGSEDDEDAPPPLVIRFGYDDAGRATRVEGTGGYHPFEVRATYDAYGRLVAEELRRETSAGPSARRLERVYDVEGRLTTSRLHTEATLSARSDPHETELVQSRSEVTLTYLGCASGAAASTPRGPSPWVPLGHEALLESPAEMRP